MTRAFRLSDSSLTQLHTCERMYQLDRLLAGSKEKQDFPNTVFGRAWGAAVANYLVKQDVQEASYTLWLDYFPNLENKKKTQAVCYNLLQAAIPVLDNILQEWEILVFNNKPAVELGFRLNIDSQYYFVGYMDAVMRNRSSGRCAVFDAKTTGLNLFDLSPLYQNNPQLVGYSIVLDQIVGEKLAEYDVGYLVGQLGAGNGFQPNVKLLTFAKTLQDRLHWFISLGLDVEHLKNMAQYNIYPQRGHNCLQYMKPCRHFGTCQLFSFDRPADSEKETAVQDQEEAPTYQFTFELDAVIDDHLRRIQA